MKAIVCGDRSWEDQAFVFRMLDLLRPTFVIEGGQTGVDLHARKWAEGRGVPHVTEDADWTKYGRAAGPKRNKLMLDEHQPDAVIAFPGGTGTRNMISQANKAGTPVVLVSSFWLDGKIPALKPPRPKTLFD